MGMGMTEKQGGSDVRANTTRAYPAGKPGPGGEYQLIGHKWFFSAPMRDGFLVLAYTEGGLAFALACDHLIVTDRASLVTASAWCRKSARAG